jgi:hypothetical protein
LGTPKAKFKIFRNISQRFVILMVNEKGRYMKSGKLLLITTLLISCMGEGIAQQQVDKNFVPQPFSCKLCDSVSPIVAVDAAHYNYHTVDNRFAPFGKVLSADGFNVKSNNTTFTEESLTKFDVLVIANALSDKNSDNWDLPIYYAFTRGEIEAVYNWVINGGALFLIADHMPWPAASANLAEMFGFSFFNGYVEITGESEQFFSILENSLLPGPVVTSEGESAIDRVQGFLGQGFLIPPKAIPVLKFTRPAVSWMPEKSWNIEDTTPYFDATNYYQGALLEVGTGRIAVFGEAGMFTAQIVTEDNETWEMGMNADNALQNQQLLINIMRWLVRVQ